MRIIGLLIALTIVAFLTIGDLSAKRELAVGDDASPDFEQDLQGDFSNVNRKNMHKILEQAQAQSEQRSRYYDEGLE